MPLAAPLLALLCSACSDDTESLGLGGGVAGASDAGDPLIVPVDLAVVAKPGGCGELAVTALTLQRGNKNVELFAAVKNEGDTPACSPAFSVELRGDGEVSLAAGVGGLLVRSFYRLDDDSGSVAGCVAPGDRGMVAITDLPSDLALEETRELIYFCNFWELEGQPLAGVEITDVRATEHAQGTTFTGLLVNGFQVPFTAPSVAVFPLNRGGRPLGVAVGEDDDDVPPGGTWQFETAAVDRPGADYVAYPSHGP